MKAIIIIVVLLLVGGGIWYFAIREDEPATEPGTTNQTGNEQLTPSEEGDQPADENQADGAVDLTNDEDAEVEIEDMAFGPQAIRIKRGTTVTWKNRDGMAHTVTSTGSGPLNSGNLNDGQEYSFTFNSAGTFSYICEIHPQMRGTVIVE